MSPAATILAVAGDPGGANALLPVLRALRKEGLNVIACPYREAVGVWRGGGIAATPLEERSEPMLRLRNAGAAALLTATSMNGVDLEKRFIAASHSLALPSLAVLDFWSHYRERFSDASGKLAFVPDQIAVMDEQARDEAHRCGLPAERLVITGQPAFDHLHERRERFSAQDRAALRHKLGVAPDHLLVVFLSQPFSETVGNKFGFTELSVLEQVSAALAPVQQRHPERIVLLIRPHPREDPGKFIASRPGFVCTEGDGREVVMAADLVVGMNTVLLQEACLMRCIVLSVQPNLSGQDVLPSNRTGWSRAVYNPDNIEPTLEQMLFDANARAAILARLATIVPQRDATRKVVEVIHQMMSRGARRP